MSNLNIIEYQIPLPISLDYRILNRNRNNNKEIKRTIMIPINKREESEIDNIGKKTLHFHRGNRTFSVQMKDIYCYGEVDFTNKDILDEIDEFKFLDYLGGTGLLVYSKYDYFSHSCSSPHRTALWTETWSPARVAKLAHGYLNKPNRILLFNETIRVK